MPRMVRRHLVYRNPNHYRKQKVLDRVFFTGLGVLIVVLIQQIGGLL